MRRNYLMKSISIILILLMMFSCQPANENVHGNDDVVTTGTIVGKAMYSNVKSHAGIQITLVSTDGIIAYDSTINNLSRASGGVKNSVVTSESGEYSFTNVKEGMYTIYASSQDSMEKAVLTNITVCANETVTVSDLNLTATGSISGVLKIDGKTSGNVGFVVFVSGTSYLAVTSDTGDFEIFDVPAGKDYKILIMKGDYCTIWETVSVEACKENKLGEKNIASQQIEDDTSCFIWQGSFAIPPTNPEKYWAYFDTNDGCSYIYDGEEWTLLAQAGADGENNQNGGSSNTGNTENVFNTYDIPLNLATVTIPKGVTVIESSAFADFYNLESVIIPDSVTYVSDNAFRYCTKLTNIIIPDRVTYIGYEAFYGCNNLKNVTISNSVITIGDSMFCGCSSLKSVTIPDNVITIGDNAFEGCISLEEVTIGDGVTTIGESAFYDCSSLKSVTIPDNVTIIDSNAFEGCISLEEVIIGDGVNTIGESAFYDCSYLKSVTIPDNVTIIDSNAFGGCISLEEVIIGDGVTTIGESAFYDCSNLTKVNYRGTEKQWKQISIGSDNEYLTGATINYNYTGE